MEQYRYGSVELLAHYRTSFNTLLLEVMYARNPDASSSPSLQAIHLKNKYSMCAIKTIRYIVSDSRILLMI